MIKTPRPSPILGSVTLLVGVFLMTQALSQVADTSGLPKPSMLALSEVTIVDIEAGLVHPGQTLLLDEGRITAVGTAGEVEPPEDAKVVNLSGRYLIPGLWDMHFHPEHPEDLDLLLVNGVLGARVLFGQPAHLAWRAEIELGMRLGPRLFLCGPIIEGRPPPGMENLIGTAGRRLLETREEGIAEARAQHAAGYDYLKVYNNLPVPAYEGLIEEAGRLGMQVIGHVPIPVGIYKALEAGQTSIEHLRGSIQVLVPPDAPIQPDRDLRSRTLAWQYIDTEDRMRELVERTAESGAYHCPTLAARLFFSRSAEVEAHLARPESRFFQPNFRYILENRERVKWLSNFSEADYEAGQKGFEMQHLLLRAMQAAGVPLLAGTDMGPWGFSLHDELELLVKAGLTTKEVLATATIHPARFSGVAEESGHLRAGARADIVVLASNPLEDIRNIRLIEAVIAKGHYLDRADLDAKLESIAQSERFGEAGSFDPVED